jgi:hypothetical protein
MTIVVFSVGVFLMNSRTWTVAEAKAKFSEVVENARVNGPQTITKNVTPLL